MELVLAVVLVVLVIFAFLGSLRATVIASVAVPISRRSAASASCTCWATASTT